MSNWLRPGLLAKTMIEKYLNPVMLVFIGYISLEYSDEYPCAKVSVIFFSFFASLCDGQISYQQHHG